MDAIAANARTAFAAYRTLYRLQRNQKIQKTNTNSFQSPSSRRKTEAMEKKLFYIDNNEFFNTGTLREQACSTMRNSSLIRRCMDGDLEGAKALLVGFWPFVSAFEKAIDARLTGGGLKRQPLYEKFGKRNANKHIVSIAKTIRNLEESEIEFAFNSAQDSLKDMQHEEWTHAAHWIKDAENLNLNREILESATRTTSVEKLINDAKNPDLVEFFALLSGTEFIAEELAHILAHNDAYTQLFARKRAIWMEVHTIPDPEGISHLDIDLDLMRAYSNTENSRELQDVVLDVINLFGVATEEVNRTFPTKFEPICTQDHNRPYDGAQRILNHASAIA